MKKVFLSQPMRGMAKEEIEEARERIFRYLEEYLGEPVREIPSYIPKLAEQMHPLYCLGASLQLMSGADLAVFAPGWESARGCRIEHECALQYGIRILDLGDGQLEGDLE